MKGKIVKCGAVCGMLCAIIKTDTGEGVWFLSRVGRWVKLGGVVARDVQSKL